jgi:hypothetical protein
MEKRKKKQAKKYVARWSHPYTQTNARTKTDILPSTTRRKRTSRTLADNKSQSTYTQPPRQTDEKANPDEMPAQDLLGLYMVVLPDFDDSRLITKTKSSQKKTLATSSDSAAARRRGAAAAGAGRREHRGGVGQAQRGGVASPWPVEVGWSGGVGCADCGGRRRQPNVRPPLQVGRAR